MDLDFLLTRDADLVVLGVRLRGVDDAAAAAGTVIAVPGARAELVFPPQHIAEQTVDAPPGPLWVALAQLSGSSIVSYDLEPGATIDLTVEGILAACRTASSAADAATSVELPWGLAFRPAASGGTRTEHAAAPLESAAGVVGLWLTRFQPAVAGTELRLTALSTGLAASGPTGWSLTADARTKIAADAAGRPASAARVELSALGGSLTAEGVWDGFR